MVNSAIQSVKNVLFLDQLDSFTFNVIDMLAHLGASVNVVNAEEIEITLQNNSLDERREYLLKLLNPYDAVILGPGPGKPSDYFYLSELLTLVELQRKPVLGICLGLQAIAEYFGWKVIHAAMAKHGKQDLINHAETGLFQDIKTPMQVGRYHSLVVSPVEKNTLFLGDKSGGLVVIGITHGAEVMALKHEILPITAVQFHPESVLTPNGKILLGNWLESI